MCADNGAFYYYHLDEYNTYEETMIKVAEYHTSAGIPVQSYQLDSWWYYKYLYFDGGLVLWEPHPEGYVNGVPLWYPRTTVLVYALEFEGDCCGKKGSIVSVVSRIVVPRCQE